MNKLFQIYVVSLFLISNYVLGQQKLSLNDAVKITLENNLDIKIVENQDEIFKNNASFLNSGYLPTISSNAGVNKSEQNIINMLLDHDQLTNDQLNKIKKGSPEIGKTELETAFEFKFTDKYQSCHP